MDIDRRRLIALTALTGAMPVATFATPAVARRCRRSASMPPNSACAPAAAPTRPTCCNRAIDQTAGARVPLVLGPGDYRTGELKLPTGTQLVGVRGATRLDLHRRRSADLGARRRSRHALRPRARRRRPAAARERRAHPVSRRARNLRIVDCEILDSSRNGIALEAVDGIVSGTTVCKRARTPRSSRAMRAGSSIQGNIVRGAGNNGILVWRSQQGRRRHAGDRQPHRGHRQQARRLGPVRQRHQRVPRRQRDRARQPHQPRGVLRRARQRRLQPPDRSATSQPTSARSRSIPSSASRAR